MKIKLLKLKYSYLFAFAMIFTVAEGLYAQRNFKIIGYLPTYCWSYIPTLDFGKVTHVNLSFANPNANGNLVYSQKISDVVVPAHKKNTKVFISIGGGSVTSTVLAYYTNRLKPENRDAFVKNLITFVIDNNLDGIDVDFENDALLVPYYNEFVVQLSTELHKVGKEISAAVARWSGDRINKSTLDSFDWISLMCYDVTAPWRPETPGPHAPMSKVTSDFAYWNSTRQVDGKKITIGVPFYGYEFVNPTTVNELTFNEIVTLYPGSEYTDVVNGNLYYNGIPTITQKTEFAFQNAGGIMFWQWGQDATGSKSLLTAIYNKTISLKTDIKQVTLTDKIYINQITHHLIIELLQSDVCTIEIYSIFSTKMLSNVFQSHSEICTDNWQRGLYVVKLNVNERTQVVKIII